MASHVERASRLAESASKSTANEFLRLIRQVTEMLANENGTFGTLKITGRLVEVPPVGEAVIVGDLHGDLKSLVHILDETELLAKLKKDKNALLIFLGDYGDRGAQSAEVYHVVLTLKSLFPQQVILLRGNHEGPTDLIGSPHDLPRQLERRFKSKGTQVYQTLRELFCHLYTCVTLKNRIVLLHGGAPSQATTVNDIAFAHKTHPTERHLEEILWNDPSNDINETVASPRGAGKLFGEDITNRLLKLFNAKALIRGHEPCPDGCKTNHHCKVLTLFSRKGAPYNNSYGAYLRLDLSQNLEQPKMLLEAVHKF